MNIFFISYLASSPSLEDTYYHPHTADAAAKTEQGSGLSKCHSCQVADASLRCSWFCNRGRTRNLRLTVTRCSCGAIVTVGTVVAATVSEARSTISSLLCYNRTLLPDFFLPPMNLLTVIQKRIFLRTLHKKRLLA